jgi:hypothetical protein
VGGATRGGRVIGDHVDRSPGWVAAVALVSLWWLVSDATRAEDRWDFLGLVLVSLWVSVTTARYRWQVGPSPVGGTPSR